MDDIDNLYEEVKLTQDVLRNTTTDAYTNMKVLNITLTYNDDDGVLSLSAAKDTTLTYSKYDKVILKAITTSFTDPVVVLCKFYLSGYEDDAVTLHFRPSYQDGGFYLPLNQLVADLGTIGTNNTYVLEFTLYDKLENEYSQTNVLNLNLYKTNTTIDYEPSEIAKLYEMINELNLSAQEV